MHVLYHAHNNHYFIITMPVAATKNTTTTTTELCDNKNNTDRLQQHDSRHPVLPSRGHFVSNYHSVELIISGRYHIMNATHSYIQTK